MRDQTYKQEMREPEPSEHPDERMHMTIKHPSLRIAAPEYVDKEGKKEKIAKLSEPENPKNSV